jgi:hypothetical protein
MAKTNLPMGIFLTMLLGTAGTAPAANGESPRDTPRSKDKPLLNEAAYIPSQCYTKTRDPAGKVHNPCFSCHTKPVPSNFIDDSDLQLGYDFSAYSLVNPWKNPFKDRRSAVAAISDEAVLAYIRTSNYFDGRGAIVPAARLAKVPAAWDFNGNGTWDGFVPDARFEFDALGFDHDAQGRPTGWRAFGYYPFLGTFWPTNGSTDDVLIRLPAAFRTNPQGAEDLDVYKTNLAIVEAMVKERDIAIDPVDEAALGGVDLDKDGRIGTAAKIAYDWAPLDKRDMSYVGKARDEQRAGRVHLAAGLYPEGTEFLHTVRYIDVGESGANRLAARMKEVRYAKKRYWMSYADLHQQALDEIKEQHDFPDRLRTVRGDSEAGVSNDQGWTYAALIEDAEGRLRPQSYEELVFCVGCHGGIGGNRDGIFSFHRKFDYPGAHQQGWYHWSQKDLRGTPERRRADGQYEYSHYLKANGAGDEFRGNTEVLEKFFTAQGELKAKMLNRLHADISTLLYASERRALELDKAYWVIVKDQSFREGRDATTAPVANVHDKLEDGEKTGVRKPIAGF